MKRIAIVSLIVISFYQLSFAKRLAPTVEQIKQANEKKQLFNIALNNKIQEFKDAILGLESIEVGRTFFSDSDYQEMIDLLNQQEYQQLKEYSKRMY